MIENERGINIPPAIERFFWVTVIVLSCVTAGVARVKSERWGDVWVSFFLAFIFHAGWTAPRIVERLVIAADYQARERYYQFRLDLKRIEYQEPEPERVYSLPEPSVKDYILGMWMPTLDKVVAREQLAKLAHGYFIRSKPLTHTSWTPAKQNGFSEGQFTSVQHILVNNTFAEWLDDTHKAGIRLTKRGEDFLGYFLPEKYKRTTSPQGGDLSISPPPTYEAIDRQYIDTGEVV